MEKWQDRLIVEARDLSDRLSRLKAYLAGDNILLLDKVDQALLRRQAEAMETYSEILDDRIARFNR